MARFCTYFTENPYEPCTNIALKGTYRCAEHPQEYNPGRQGDMTEAMRRSILERDNHKCVKCGARAEEVNHIVAFSSFAPEDKWKANMASNLESLCRSCHKEITNEQRREWIVVDDMYDFSTSARNRKKKRRRKYGL